MREGWWMTVPDRAPQKSGNVFHTHGVMSLSDSLSFCPPYFPPLQIPFFSVRFLSLSEFCWSYRQSCLCLGLSYQAGCNAASSSVLPSAYSPQCQWLCSQVSGFKALLHPQGLQTRCTPLVDQMSEPGIQAITLNIWGYTQTMEVR